MTNLNSYINIGANTANVLGNVTAGGNEVVVGNITANMYFGNGSQLTGTYGNINVANYLANGADPTIDRKSVV